MTGEPTSASLPLGGELVEVAEWGEVDGAPVQLVTLVSRSGVRVSLTTFGATLVSIELPQIQAGRDSGSTARQAAGTPAAATHKNMVDVLLGLPDLDSYRRPHPYLGGTIGRVANRVSGASFELSGRRFALSANQPGLQVHGGVRGFDRRPWQLENADTNAAGHATARLGYRSVDGEEGYPGNMSVTFEVELSAAGWLSMALTAQSDRDTPVALTQHPYFNLAGHGNILDHELKLFSSFYAPIAPSGLPTGEVRSVAGTPFDFREGKSVGADLGHPVVAARGGYDDAFVITGRPGELRPAARLTHVGSGRRVELFTTQLGLQVYSANHFDGSVHGKGGVAYRRHAGLALEAQALPNAVNLPHLGDVILKRGARYRQLTEYRFTW